MVLLDDKSLRIRFTPEEEKKIRPILTKVCVYLKCNKVENIISAWDSIIFFSSSLHTNDKMKRKKRRKKDVWTKTIEFSVFAFFNSIYLLNKEKKPSPEMEENESKIVLSAKGLSPVVYARNFHCLCWIYFTQYLYLLFI